MHGLTALCVYLMFESLSTVGFLSNLRENRSRKPRKLQKDSDPSLKWQWTSIQRLNP
jgi:hypothetical protein